ncbi:MAG: glycosyltransferase, partial [Candidatus Cloacimonadota bacterium]
PPIWEKVDIIFLTHNMSDMSLECLNALKKNTHHPFRLIWIDNGSEMVHYRKIREKVEDFNYIGHRFDVNRFYARAINQGIVMSNARYIVTLSNDVFVTDGWLRKLLSIMESNPKVGIVSPLTDRIGSPVCKADFAAQKWRLPVRGNYCEQINRLPERYGRTSSSISMFCSMIRSEVMDKIGLLDERFFILGNDDDYCDRVRLAGFETAVCLNCFVYHKHSVTKDLIFKPKSIERMAIKRDHQALLREKRQLRAMTGDLK